MQESEYRFESKIKGFTLVPDVLVQEVGFTAAGVYGRVWRYAQQKNKVCYASIGKIAKEMRMGISTITRHLKTLVEEGYLIDYTPDLRHKPHTYGVTNKVEILQTTEAKINKNTSEVVQNERPGSSKRTTRSFNLNVKDSIREYEELKTQTKVQTKVCEGNDSRTSSTTIKEALKEVNNPLGFLGKEYRELGQAFLEHAGADYSPMSKGDKSLWVRELKTWRSIRVVPGDIKSVVNDMRKRGLSIKSPVSITGMLRDYRSRQSKVKDKVFAGNIEDLY